MEDAPNRSAGPNWVETHDGEIMPSYGPGPNAPKYPNLDPEARRMELAETHPEFVKPREEYRTDYEAEDAAIGLAEYDMDEAATLGALHDAATGRRGELYKPLTKSERLRAKAAMTDEDIERAAKGIADARNHLNLIQGDK